MALISRSTVATLALATGLVFVAGTGGAVAGALITGKQIKDGTVTTADIRNGSLTGVDVKDGSIAGVDVKDGTVGTGDLSASARNAFADRGVSGSVTSNGVLTIRSKPSGSTVTVQQNLGGTEGWWCVTVSGGARQLTPETATLVASPDYKHDSTNFTDSWSAVVESSTHIDFTGCAGGFRLTTMLRVPESEGALIRSNEAFVFQIN